METTMSSTIRRIRLDLKMTQLDLAQKIGSSYSYICRLEAGKVDPRWSTIEKIFRVYNAALFTDGYLFNLIDKKNA